MPEAIERYENPSYKLSQRLTSCGYNLFNLGGVKPPASMFAGEDGCPVWV